MNEETAFKIGYAVGKAAYAIAVAQAWHLVKFAGGKAIDKIVQDENKAERYKGNLNSILDLGKDAAKATETKNEAQAQWEKYKVERSSRK